MKRPVSYTHLYVGATEFGMRSAPKNFTMEQLAEGVRFAHARGRRVYLTLNTVPTKMCIRDSAIGKQFEPLLLLPIAFGMLLANLPFGEIIHMPVSYTHLDVYKRQPHGTLLYYLPLFCTEWQLYVLSLIHI